MHENTSEQMSSIPVPVSREANPHEGHGSWQLAARLLTRHGLPPLSLQNETQTISSCTGLSLDSRTVPCESDRRGVARLAVYSKRGAARSPVLFLAAT